MSTIIKHVFKFQEQRRTIFLHASNKDNFGRHRGNVLYGMKLTPVGTKVQIGPGALCTAFGTRLYLDIQDTTGLLSLDLNDTAVVNITNQSIFSSNHNGERPLVVAIIMKFDAYGAADPADLPQAKQVESTSEVATEITLEAKIVSWDRATINPTFHIKAQNPIFMNQGDQSDALTADYGVLNNYNAPSVNPSPLGADAGALVLDEIVLGYIIIGTITDVQFQALPGYPSISNSLYFPTQLESTITTGAWADGVSCVQCRNSWEALDDFLGADVLFGRNDKMVLTAPSGVTALAQNAGVWNVGPTGFDLAGTSTLMFSPKFGTTGLTSGQFQPAQQNYRLPSFMRDGDQILNVMRRLDYILRLWMDRTGDQQLIGQIQDGSATGQTLMSPLLNILNAFDGGPNSGTNLNTVAYHDSGLTASQQTPGTDPNNRVLKSGLIPHADIQATDINAILTAAYGDTQLSGLRALDIAIGNILHNVFGLNIARSLLRTTVDWTVGGVYSDLPINLTTLPNVPFSGATSPYVGPTINKLIPAINQLLYRSERTVGPNLLQNGGLWSKLGIAPGWVFSTSVTFSQSQLGTGVSYISAPSWPVGTALSQVITLTDGVITNLSGYLYKTAGLLSASVLLQNTQQMALALYSDSTLISSISVPPSSVPRTVSMSVDLSGATLNSTSLTFKIINTDVSSSAVVLYGASVNAGMPNPCPVSAISQDFLSRDGSGLAPMRGDIVMSANDVFFGTGDHISPSVVWPAHAQTIAAPTDAGAAVSQYLTTEGAKAALVTIDNRTVLGVGPNWCQNPTGTATDRSSGNQGTMPMAWYAAPFSTLNWSAFVTASGCWTQIIGTDYVENTVFLPSYPDLYAADLLSVGGLISASALVSNTHASNGLQLQIVQYATSTPPRILLTSNVIGPLSSGAMYVTAKITRPNGLYDRIGVRLVSTGGSSNISMKMYGVCLNAGMPQQTPGWSSKDLDFVPSQGGPNHPMAGALYMGGNVVKHIAAGVAFDDAARIDQLPTVTPYVPPVHFLQAYKNTPEQNFSSIMTSGHVRHSGGIYGMLDSWYINCDTALQLTTPNQKARWRLRAKVFAVVDPAFTLVWKWSCPNFPGAIATAGAYASDQWSWFDEAINIYPHNRAVSKSSSSSGSSGAFNNLYPASPTGAPASIFASTSDSTGWDIETDQVLDIDANGVVGFWWYTSPRTGSPTLNGQGIVQNGIITLDWIQDLS